MFEQELGRLKRLHVRDAQGKTFIALDGNAVKATDKFDALQAVNIIGLMCELVFSNHELVTYHGGLIIVPSSEHFREVG